MKVATDKATLNQLRKFATSTLGLEIAPTSNRLQVLAQVQQAWNEPEIDVDGEDSAAPASRKAAPKAAAPGKVNKDGEPDHKVAVMIHIVEEPGGADRVPLSVNGKAMLVERNIEQVIPYRYYKALEQAVEKRYDPLPDGKGYNPIARLVPRYPYTVLRAVA